MKNQILRFLRWSEKYTKTDMVYLAEGGFWLTLASVISTSSSFITSIAFANLISPDTYGIYRYVLSLLVLLTIPTLSGIDTALIRTIAKGNDGAYMPAFWTKVKWGSLAGVASVILSFYYHLQGDQSLTFSFLIAALFLPIMDPLMLYMSYLNGKKDFYTSTKYQNILNLAASTIIVAVLFFSKNILVIIFTYFAAYTFLRLILFLITKNKIEVPPQEDAEVTSYGKHLSLMSILVIISTSLDKVLIFHSVSAAALAGYYIASAPFKQVQGILGSINVLAFPNFSNNDIPTLKKTLPAKILRSYVFIILIIVTYLVISPYAFRLIYPQYTSFTLLSNIFIFQLLLYPISFFHTAVTALGEKKLLYYYTTFYSIFRIICLLILVPLFGIYGAATAILVTSLVSALVLTYMFYRI